MVIKRDKSREPFDRGKLLSRLLRACVKRPVPLESLEKLINAIEYSFANEMIKEVHSTEIGNLVLSKLRTVDEVAYIRFASVYKDFKDIDSFLAELSSLHSSEHAH